MTFLCILFILACADTPEAPPGGWANTAPTVVTEVVDRDARQLLAVRQGALSAWVEVPNIDAEVSDYVLLGQGSMRTNVDIPELGRVVSVVDIEHAAVVDEATAQRVVADRVPPGALGIATVYEELAQRAGDEVVVHGTVVKATSAVGSVWVHLQDGTGNAAAATNDLTIQTSELVSVGQRVAFRGTLRANVELGFGYRYDALVEDATRVGLR